MIRIEIGLWRRTPPFPLGFILRQMALDSLLPHAHGRFLLHWKPRSSGMSFMSRNKLNDNHHYDGCNHPKKANVKPLEAS